ncbi:hypothetical protein Gotur_024114 [Gossypium turneri]
MDEKLGLLFLLDGSSLQLRHLSGNKKALDIFETSQKGTNIVKESKMQMLTTKYLPERFTISEYGKLCDPFDQVFPFGNEYSNFKLVKKVKDINTRINEIIGSLRAFKINLDKSRRNISKGEKSITLQVTEAISTEALKKQPVRNNKFKAIKNFSKNRQKCVVINDESTKNKKGFLKPLNSNEKYVSNYVAFFTKVNIPVTTNSNTNDDLDGIQVLSLCRLTR